MFFKRYRTLPTNLTNYYTRLNTFMLKYSISGVDKDDDRI